MSDTEAEYNAIATPIMEDVSIGDAEAGASSTSQGAVQILKDAGDLISAVALVSDIPATAHELEILDYEPKVVVTDSVRCGRQTSAPY